MFTIPHDIARCSPKSTMAELFEVDSFISVVKITLTFAGRLRFDVDGPMSMHRQFISHTRIHLHPSQNPESDRSLQEARKEVLTIHIDFSPTPPIC